MTVSIPDIIALGTMLLALYALVGRDRPRRSALLRPLRRRR